jgi:glycosyltransferase involved in cell wall biosynthesis
MRILYLATHNVKCGIATYTEQLRNQLGCEHALTELPVGPHSRLLDSSISQFVRKARRYDVVHIQHEHGLFVGDGDESDAIERFGNLLSQLSIIDIPVYVTFHSDPVFYTDTGGFSVMTIMKKCLSRMWRKKVAKWFQPKYNITAIVHTDRTRKEFIQSTFHEGSVVVVPHGVIDRDIEFRPVNPRTKVQLSIFGFISSYKGYHVALKALQLLPENYKLICMGGRHPNSTGDEYTQILGGAKALDHGTVEHGLGRIYRLVSDRVEITGFLEEEQADVIHKKTDICLAPYTDKTLSGSGALTWSITSGRATIASNIPSFQAINDEYQCMHLFKTDAHHELAWSIKRVAENVKYQCALVSGANKYSQELSWSNVAKTHMNLYESVANSSEEV